MKGYWKATMALLSACTSVSTASFVTKLTRNTMNGFISQHEVVMVEFHAPWCQVCRELEPIYEKTASILDTTKDIQFASIDCVADPDLCEKYRISIYPTLYVFKGLDDVEIYNGPREPSDMITFSSKRYGPPVTALTRDMIEDFKASHTVAVLGFWEASDSSANATFTRVAKSLLDDFNFGATNSLDLAKLEGITQPAVILYKQFDERRVVHDGEFEQSVIASFIDNASFPVIGVFDQKSIDRYFNQDALSFAGIFADTPKEREQLAEMIRPIAENQRTKLRFATVDTTKYAKFASRFNLKEDDFPAFAILNSKDQKFPIPQGTKLTRDSISRWVEDFSNNKLSPHFKSEPIPQLQEGPVTIVVRSNYEELVVNNNQDVLLEFYAPWCGHCKALAPSYEKLARLYGKYDPQVMIAKVDATSNDIPGHAISSFPTIKFFPAEKKDSPVQYIGNRTLEDLARFVQRISTNKVDLIEFLGNSETITAEPESLEANSSRDEL